MASGIGKKKRALLLFTVLFIVVALVWNLYKSGTLSELFSPDKPATSQGALTVEFLDVAQADAELIYLPDGKTALIDTGDLGDGDRLADYLSKKGIRRIDYLIATHPHSDHIGGICEVIEGFAIGKIFAPRIADSDLPTSKIYESFLKAVQKKGLKITTAKAGETLFEGTDYKGECFAPASQNEDGLNNYSVTIKLTYGIHSFLFTGDAEAESEERMLSGGHKLDCDVLKLGHHGSSSSTTDRFLKAVSPQYAVISCGADNSYGHPHKETLERLESLKGLKKYYRTDLDKTVIFTADGKTEDGIKITTQNESVV